MNQLFPFSTNLNQMLTAHQLSQNTNDYMIKTIYDYLKTAITTHTVHYLTNLDKPPAPIVSKQSSGPLCLEIVITPPNKDNRIVVLTGYKHLETVTISTFDPNNQIRLYQVHSKINLADPNSIREIEETILKLIC